MEVEEGALSVLPSILIYVFVALSLLIAVAAIGYAGAEREEEGPSRIIIIVQTYIKEHRKPLLLTAVGMLVMLLLWLVTYI